MSQRSKQSSLNYPCSDISTKAPRKDRQRFTKPSTPVSCIHKSKDRHSEKYDVNQHLLKGTSVKQQNITSGNSTPTNVLQYSASDESAVVEVTLKTSNPPKQRSKSTVSDREPWGQLLKKQKSKDSDSVFGTFDPLRSLHFLSKELQIHVETLYPEEKNIQEIIKAMQMALKRVPPEVASTIHLQQSIGLLPGMQKSVSQKSMDCCGSDRPYLITEHKSVQTHISSEKEEVIKMQRIMEESTIKLEESCRQLETICTQLKNEKLYLETQLQNERDSIEFFRKKIGDLENLNKDLSHTLYKKDEEIAGLKSNLQGMEQKIEQIDLNKNEVKIILTELKQSKSTLEQECVKLKHQLRLCAIEKEKYLAILAVRDRQIHEIRNEMTQLQEVVNNQLVELHSNALAAMPSNSKLTADGKFKDNDWASPSKDNNVCDTDNIKKVRNDCLDQNDPVESDTNVNIRDMFSEIKRQAMALSDDRN
ncbi:hypothetical protein GWI33_018559 [Rhynchophorus ferrugineus]|uniref:Uncharacterized protein n=1 Tax=Rhynchophorus ferrugineus TaxID=354439 RepID=A0A834M535_RHYFE|nr:hypothetical protein GWI33_018559 [Rhynchophorus ferrugineus]